MSDASKIPEELSLPLLAARCAEETTRFFQVGMAQEQFCFELFRRALVLRNQAAWECIHAQYHTLVAGWVKRHKAFPTCHEEVDYFANGAFARFYSWCDAQLFPHFATLADLLAGLKVCVHSEIIDHQRKQAHALPLQPWDDAAGETLAAPSPTPEATFIDEETRAKLWALVQQEAKSEQERVVIELAFALGHKAGQIHALRPDLFATVKEVYRVKEHLMERLRRKAELRRIFDDFIPPAN